MKRAGWRRRAAWLRLPLPPLMTRHLLLILLLLRLLMIATVMLLARVSRRRLAGFARCHLALRWLNKISCDSLAEIVATAVPGVR